MGTDQGGADTASPPIGGLHAVIPVKSQDHAKSRLGEVLTQKHRRGLARRMLDDTLAALTASSVQTVWVVTNNRAIQRRARAAGAEVISEPPAERPGNDLPHAALNRALEEGRRAAVERGAQALLTVPIDLILLPSFDLDSLLSRIRHLIEEESDQAPSVFLETDDRRDGTNFLLQYPPNEIPFRYGRGSLRDHESEAVARGRRFRELDEPVLRWDLDHPGDPERWARALDGGEGAANLKRHLQAALELGTALRFLFDTEWAEPLRKSV